MKEEKTHRGFSLSNFEDSYGNKCSLQQSSNIDPHIWLGVDNPDIFIHDKDNHGRYVKVDTNTNHFSCSSRMHLTQEQVKELLPILEKFVNTGEI